MKVLKIDHIGIAVKSLEETKTFYEELLGLDFAGKETVEEQKVTTAFFPCNVMAHLFADFPSRLSREGKSAIGPRRQRRGRWLNRC